MESTGGIYFQPETTVLTFLPLPFSADIPSCRQRKCVCSRLRLFACNIKMYETALTIFDGIFPTNPPITSPARGRSTQVLALQIEGKYRPNRKNLKHYLAIYRQNRRNPRFHLVPSDWGESRGDVRGKTSFPTNSQAFPLLNLSDYDLNMEKIRTL